MSRIAFVVGILAAILVVGSSLTARQDVPASPVGVWNLEGEDNAKNRWIGTIVVKSYAEESQSLAKLKGYIEWLSDKSGTGREYVTGEYDPATRTLKLKGCKHTFARGIILGNYAAKLSKKGDELTDGKWPDGIEGVWSAKREVIK